MGGEELSDAGTWPKASVAEPLRDELLQLCRQRLDAFRMQRGEEVFAHRSRHRTPISGSIKVRVLTQDKGRCECCGAHEHQRALEVDHIVPRNQGGSDELSNLQALCFRCNAGKRDTDTTDFRGLQASYARRQDGCVFCALEASSRVLLENALEAVNRRCRSVTPGHSLEGRKPMLIKQDQSSVCRGCTCGCPSRFRQTRIDECAWTQNRYVHPG